MLLSQIFCFDMSSSDGDAGPPEPPTRESADEPQIERASYTTKEAKDVGPYMLFEATYIVPEDAEGQHDWMIRYEPNRHAAPYVRAALRDYNLQLTLKCATEPVLMHLDREVRALSHLPFMVGLVVQSPIVGALNGTPCPPVDTTINLLRAHLVTLLLMLNNTPPPELVFGPPTREQAAKAGGGGGAKKPEFDIEAYSRSRAAYEQREEFVARCANELNNGRSQLVVDTWAQLKALQERRHEFYRADRFTKDMSRDTPHGIMRRDDDISEREAELVKEGAVFCRSDYARELYVIFAKFSIEWLRINERILSALLGIDMNVMSTIRSVSIPDAEPMSIDELRQRMFVELENVLVQPIHLPTTSKDPAVARYNAYVTKKMVVLAAGQQNSMAMMRLRQMYPGEPQESLMRMREAAAQDLLAVSQLPTSDLVQYAQMNLWHIETAELIFSSFAREKLC